MVEILDLMAAWRKENPKTADIHDDRVMRFRRDIYEMMRTIGVERKLPRSYSTQAECQAKAKAVFAGSRILPGRALSGTTSPESITQIGSTANIYKIGAEDSLIEGTLAEREGLDNEFGPVSVHSFASMPFGIPASPGAEPVHPSPRAGRPKANRKPKSELPEPAFGRPKAVKELE